MAVYRFSAGMCSCAVNSSHDNKLRRNLTEMKISINALLLLKILVNYSDCVRLNPLENNDKLQSINSEFIAEWQWESWPIKVNASEKEVATPGPRLNAALWKDNTGQNWYLFGGRPIDPESEKIYSDIWKYSISSRIWERIFPFISPQEKGKYSGKLGGMVSLRVNFFDEYDGIKPHKHQNNNVVLCGRSAKRNVTKPKKNFWSNFSRRKAPEPKNLDESKSLAVYGPRTTKSNTVWQIDLKDKLWTGYVCCCDTSNYDKLDPSLKNLEVGGNTRGTLVNHTVEVVQGNPQKNQAAINLKIDKTEDEIEREQEHLTIDDSRTKRKKINQMKKKGDALNGVEKKKMKKVEDVQTKESSKLEKVQNYPAKVNISDPLKNFSAETVLTSKNQSDVMTIFKNNGGEKNVKDPKIIASIDKTSIEREIASDDWDSKVNSTENARTSSKLVSQYCPDFTDGEEPVSWCDGSNDVLITADLSSSQIVLWIFNMKTSHWSQQSVEVAEDSQWPACSNSSSMRYAGAGEEVYILCSPPEPETFIFENTTLNATEANKMPEINNSTKLVYRISSRRHILESLGKIKLSRFFKEPHHEEMWKNESNTIFQVVRLSNNETIMILAYKDVVDLWILMKNHSRYYFESMENVWRGSASKWFSKYNAANYNFHIISESNSASTILLLNPRSIPFNEYWPRERGRFIIRILKNENVKNHSLGNQTKEHNLTYDLLQSDMNLPLSESSFSHSYNVKVIIFFGISLAIFTIFGVVVFLKKCVNCPSRILMTNECHKSPPIIRYSVMHDDLLYPVA